MTTGIEETEIVHPPEDRIRVVELELNTQTSGVASATTKVLNGWLEAIQITSDNTASVEVEGETSHMPLYKIDNLRGSEFYPVRYQARNKSPELWRNSMVKHPLAEKIKVLVSGVQNTTITVKILYSI